MKVICAPESLLNNHAHELTGLEQSPHSEVPERVHSILVALKSHHCFDVEEGSVEDFGASVITRVHSPDYVEYLRTAYEEWIKCGMPESGVIPDVFSMIKVCSFSFPSPSLHISTSQGGYQRI